MHAVGGITALAMGILIGPRIGKYTRQGKALAIPGHDLLVVLLSLRDQLFLMSNAEVVFAPHGAGLTNTIFMQEGAKVLEVKHARKYPQDFGFQGLSRSVGVSHDILESEGAVGRNDDFHIDPAELEKKLAEIIGAVP